MPEYHDHDHEHDADGKCVWPKPIQDQIDTLETIYNQLVKEGEPIGEKIAVEPPIPVMHLCQGIDNAVRRVIMAAIVAGNPSSAADASLLGLAYAFYTGYRAGRGEQEIESMRYEKME